MILRTFFSTCLCIVLTTHISSQNISYARNVIDTLTSSSFHGRGAVNEGEKKAAQFIADEFNKHGLIPFKSSYLQTFDSPINTFFGKLSLQFDNLKLTAGKDYIVGGASSGIKGTFSLAWYNKKNLPKRSKLKKLVDQYFFNDKFIVIDGKDISKNNEILNLLQQNQVGAKGIILIKDKLTKGLSSKVKNYVIIHLDRKAVKKKRKKISLEINQKWLTNYKSQNVIGYFKGTNQPDSFIVVSAHYDHLGRMGDDVFFPGANDNASGISMLLNLVEEYRKNPPSKSIVFIAFGAEEIGIVGSKYFVNHPLFDLKKIKFVVNLDLLGTGSKGITVVNGTIHLKAFEKLQSLNTEKDYILAVKKRGKAANSDHYWFTEKGIPAFFIYTLGGITAYHDVYDVSKTLPLTEFEDCFRLIRDFVNWL